MIIAIVFGLFMFFIQLVGPPTTVKYLDSKAGCITSSLQAKNACQICYKYLKSQFTFISCVAYYQCTQYDSSNNQTCVRKRNQTISQAECMQYCCKFQDKKFNYFSLFQCNANYNLPTLPVQYQYNVSYYIVMAVFFGFFGGTFVCGFFYECLLCLGDSYFDDHAQNRSSGHKVQNLSKHMVVEVLKWRRRVDFLNDSKSIIASQQILHNSGTCCICLEQKTNCMTNCKHYFHIKCFTQWIHKNQFCPMCINKQYNPIRFQCQGCRQMQGECNVTRWTEFKSQFLEQIVIRCDQCLQQRLQRVQIQKQPIKCEEIDLKQVVISSRFKQNQGQD